MLQGLAFGLFYPLLMRLFAGSVVMMDVLPYIGMMVVLCAISSAAKWKGYNFDYTGNIVDITHDLRTKAGRLPEKDAPGEIIRL